MNSTEIAAFIRGFNTFTIIIASIFALCGVVAVIAKIRNRKSSIFGRRAFLAAFGIAALIAFAFEATFFNWQYYLKFFSGPETSTVDISPDDPKVILTTDGTLAILATNGIIFKDLDRKVTSVLVNLTSMTDDVIEMKVQWTDQEGTRVFSKKIYKHLPHENYMPIQPCGKVSELLITLAYVGQEDSHVDIQSITLNKPIPFYVSGLRLLVLSFLIFVVLAFANKTLRAKAAHLLFENRFNPAGFRQNAIYALVVVLLIAFSWINVYTSLPSEEKPSEWQYNRFLVDAFIAGRTHLEFGNPEKLFDAEHLYSFVYRRDNPDIVGTVDVDWLWDAVWYKGKQYSYYGVVPAIILYVPYKVFTGDYLANHTGVFLFTAVAIILMALLWRHCVRRWMPDTLFAFYLFGFITLFFTIGLYSILRHPSFYTISQTSAFMFVTGGLLLLLKSVGPDDKINRVTLFFACLCLALAVGCRVNMVFVSLLVPVVLWKHRSWKLLALVAIPYTMVAIPLCWYNYIRFGSIFEFGQTYLLTTHNNQWYHSVSPIGKAIRALMSGSYYFFNPNKYSLIYPYVECFPRHQLVVQGIYCYNQSGAGIINFPIVFCLFYLFRNLRGENRPKAAVTLLGFVAVAAAILALYISFSFQGRYSFDHGLFLMLPSLFCAYYWYSCPKSALPQRVRLKVVYTLFAVSVFVGLMLFVTGGMTVFERYDPTLYRYLEYSLGLIRMS